jgi:alpha-L-rhamnosidase
LTGTAFYYWNLRLLAQIANVLEHREEALEAGALARRVKDAFNQKFLKPGTGRYDAGWQTCQATPLYFDLVPPAERDATLETLVRDIEQAHQGHLTTGLFGTKFMPMALSDLGRPDVAYEVVNQKTFPGWGYMLERGATTLWEHWEYSDNTFSHNHPMFGVVSEWLLKVVAGLRPADDAVAFHKIVIRPRPLADLKWGKGSYLSVRGPISTSWRVEAGRFSLEVVLPPNTTATVYVPARSSADVSEGGRPAAEAPGVQWLRMDRRSAVFAVDSGRYSFASALP